MIGRMLEWERTKRENAKAVDARGKSAKEENLARGKEAKATRLAAETGKREAKRGKKRGYAGLDMEAVLTDSERSEILAKEMKRFMGGTKIWRVGERGDTWVQLVDPAIANFGIIRTLLAICTLGVSLLEIPIRRGMDQDHPLYINVAPNGMIERTGHRTFAGKDYSNVPEVSNKEL